jgi:hypothetical protein
VLHLIALEKLCNSPIVDNLLCIVVWDLKEVANLKVKDVASKVFCFGVDGVIVYQGTCTTVTI